jgi:AraC-like DNA-binding protein
MLPEARIDSVARALAITPRTLQRRLDDESVRFTDVLDRVRDDLAREWLASSERSLGEIAARLGFADLATFGRAFKRWTGTTPGAFRRG